LAFNQRLQSQNIVHMLQNRESGYTYKISQSAPLVFERPVFTAVTPRLTVGIIIPPVYLRKFTPDGSKLLAFSHDQRSCIVYAYNGIGAAGVGKLLDEACVASAENLSDKDINLPRSKIFECLFKTKYVLRLCQGKLSRYYLHREFSIFFEDGRYVLLAGMCVAFGFTLPLADYERFPDLFDKLDPFSYIFFVVDLQNGIVTDEVELPQDVICLSHNHGVSVYGNTIVILSRLRQTMYIYELVNGRLVKQEQDIGPRPRDCVFNPTTDRVEFDVNTLLPITHIKQRALSFLYRQIQPDSPDRVSGYQEFYKNFEFMENMIIEKMQLVDNNLLLLRYEKRPLDIDLPISLTTGEPTPPRRLYVFYRMDSEDVIGVYQDDSVELLQIVLHFYDKLCNARSLQTGDAPTSPILYLMQQQYNKPVPFVRQSAMRFNPSVPVSTQSFSTSPYLNFNVFSYEERFVSPLERPKVCSTEPIVFRDRETNLVKFRLNIKARRAHTAMAPRELCAFIFHPYEPLAISIQKCVSVYAYKLHVYHHSTVVEQ
ncbi:abo, partial [Drosophila busckii]